MIFVITRLTERDVVVALVRTMVVPITDVHGIINQSWQESEGDESRLVSILGDKGFEILAFCDAELPELEDIDEEDDDNDGDDLCDQCMRSGVIVARTNSKGETICEDCDETYEDELDIRYRCPECGHEWEEVYAAACDSECDECGTDCISAVMWKEVGDEWSDEQNKVWSDMSAEFLSRKDTEQPPTNN